MSLTFDQFQDFRHCSDSVLLRILWIITLAVTGLWCAPQTRSLEMIPGRASFNTVMFDCATWIRHKWNWPKNEAVGGFVGFFVGPINVGIFNRPNHVYIPTASPYEFQRVGFLVKLVGNDGRIYADNSPLIFRRVQGRVILQNLLAPAGWFHGNSGARWHHANGWRETAVPNFNIHVNLYPTIMLAKYDKVGIFGSWDGPEIRALLVLRDYYQAVCSARLTSINDQQSESNEDGEDLGYFFPSWGWIISAVAGIGGVGWGWWNLRDNRTIRWSLLAFIAGCILWMYGFAGLLMWISARPVLPFTH